MLAPGVPLTVGFLGKLLVLGTGVQGARWVLVLLLAAGSAIGVFYYLRVVATMFLDPVEPQAAASRSWLAWSPVALAAAAMVVLGIVPGPLLELLARW